MYVPGMLAIENIEAGKFDAKIARLLSSDELHVAALQAWYLREALNLVYDWSTRSMKRALATYCCCENASKIVSDLISMRCGILTLRQGNVLRAEPSNPCKTILF